MSKDGLNCVFLQQPPLTWMCMLMVTLWWKITNHYFFLNCQIVHIFYISFVSGASGLLVFCIHHNKLNEFERPFNLPVPACPETGTEWNLKRFSQKCFHDKGVFCRNVSDFVLFSDYGWNRGGMWIDIQVSNCYYTLGC